MRATEPLDHFPSDFPMQRTMGGAPESSEGAALYKVDTGLSGGPAYGFIAYQ